MQQQGSDYGWEGMCGASDWSECRCASECVMANGGQPGQPVEQLKLLGSKGGLSGSLRAPLGVRTPVYL